MKTTWITKCGVSMEVRMATCKHRQSGINQCQGCIYLIKRPEAPVIPKTPEIPDSVRNTQVRCPCCNAPVLLLWNLKEAGK